MPPGSFKVGERVMALLSGGGYAAEVRCVPAWGRLPCCACSSGTCTFNSAQKVWQCTWELVSLLLTFAALLPCAEHAWCRAAHVCCVIKPRPLPCLAFPLPLSGEARG